MCQDVQFNSISTGASDAVPISVSSIKKGSYVVLKGCPCKVIEISMSKTGKHGHAKANIIGIDLFTGKKYQDISPTSHNMMQPIISRKEYQLIEIEKDNFVTLMDEEGNVREDLSIDVCTDDAHQKIKNDFDLKKDLTLTVIKCMGKEKIISSKEILY